MHVFVRVWADELRTYKTIRSAILLIHHSLLRLSVIRDTIPYRAVQNVLGILTGLTNVST